MKINFCVAFLFFGCISCKQIPNTNDISKVKDSIAVAATSDVSVYRFIEKYKGTLPCADCPGIVTEITFINDSLIYRENDSYLDRNLINNLTGSYTTDRGYKDDYDATVYVLDDNIPGKERRFLRLNDSTLLMLDRNGEIIDTTIRHRIFKID